MTQYTKKKRASNSKARIEGNSQRRMRPQAKPIENADDVTLTDEEAKNLFTGMLGCIFFLAAVIVILVLIIIFRS